MPTIIIFFIFINANAIVFLTLIRQGRYLLSFNISLANKNIGTESINNKNTGKAAAKKIKNLEFNN